MDAIDLRAKIISFLQADQLDLLGGKVAFHGIGAHHCKDTIVEEV